MDGSWYFFAILKNQIQVSRLVWFVDFACNWNLFDFFEVERKYHRKITLYDLFTAIPDCTSSGVKSDGFSFEQVNTTNRTKIDKVFEGTVGKT